MNGGAPIVRGRFGPAFGCSVSVPLRTPHPAPLPGSRLRHTIRTVISEADDRSATAPDTLRPSARARARRPPEDRYALALVLILATIVSLAVLGDWTGGQVVALALGGGTQLFVLRASAASRRVQRAAAALIAVGLLGTIAAMAVGEIATTPRVFGAILAFVAPLVIGRRLIRQPAVTIDTIAGALCIYLLAGLAFAYIDAGVDGVTPFFAQAGPHSIADFIYFSYITIATVGFGDLTPASNLPRMLAVAEALIGQLYLVSAVAVLVGSLGRARATGARPRGDDRK